VKNCGANSSRAAPEEIEIASAPIAPLVLFRSSPFILQMEITLPSEVPVMTLPSLVFFPQVLLPLHIFEARYRAMLRDVLGTNRLFAVACLDREAVAKFEPLHRVATVGIIRTSQQSEDGTSNLLLQGLARIECLSIVREEPYRCIRVRALATPPLPEPAKLAKLRNDVAQLIALKQRLSGQDSPELTQLLDSILEPEVFLDLAAFNVCESAKTKQRLLETPDVSARFRLFGDYLRAAITELKLREKFDGHLPDGEPGLN
jgi:Lon protease-like protein